MSWSGLVVDPSPQPRIVEDPQKAFSFLVDYQHLYQRGHMNLR